MSPTQVVELLEDQKVRFVMVPHVTTYTAQQTAEYAHVPGHALAKTVIVSIDGRMVMAVLSASHRVDLERFRVVAGARKVEIPHEKEFQDLFPGCQVGAMPPFGNLYGMEVFVDEGLAQNREIAFNACTHAELIRMAYEDFAALVRPRVARFATQ